MSIKEDIEKVQKKVNAVEKKSFAMEVLQYSKQQQLQDANKRLFVVWLVTFIAFIGLLGYTIYLLNDIGTIETTTQEVSQENTDGTNNFVGNDNHRLEDMYVVMNSLVNDYQSVVNPEEVETYIKMAHAWLDDVDGKQNKVWWYFVK